ncbi:MAG: hypothetical protein E5V88_32165, partial [Mesorhizobium sp.]
MEGWREALPFLLRWRLAKAGATSDLPLAGEMSGRTEGGAKERQRRRISYRPPSLHSFGYEQLTGRRDST